MKTVITVHNSSFSSFWLGMNFSVSTVTTCLGTQTAFLTPDSESAWKFTSKNLLHTSVYCCFRLKRLQCVKTLNFGFFEKWPVSTVSTVFKPKIPKSDTGFEISVKIYPEIRSLYAVLTLFSGVTATCENSKFEKSGGLAFLTTSLYQIAHKQCWKVHGVA